MDPLESWVDADAVKKMARELIEPAPEGSLESSENAGYGPDFVGFAPSGEKRSEKRRDQDETAKELERAVDSGPDNSKQPSGESGTVGALDPGERAEPADQYAHLGEPWRRFFDWLKQQSTVHGVLVFDDDGNTVFSSEGGMRFHAFAHRMTSERSVGKGGIQPVHVRVTGSRYLMMLRFNGRASETYVLGLLVSDLPDEGMIDSITMRFGEMIAGSGQ